MLQYHDCAYMRWHRMYQAKTEGRRIIKDVFYSFQMIHCVLDGCPWGHLQYIVDD